jgi:hypothetical protein
MATSYILRLAFCDLTETRAKLNAVQVEMHKDAGSGSGSSLNSQQLIVWPFIIIILIKNRSSEQQ